MKRQRGRGRKPGGGGGGGGGGGNHNHNHGNRSLESNGPDVKIRGTAAQIYEKYAQYARDAQSGGDRVKYENYLQHAEHYYRVMAATMPRERLLQQQQEGGMQQGQQPTVEGNVPHQENVVNADQGEAVRPVDEAAGDSDDGDDEVEASDEAEEAEAAAPEARKQQAQQVQQVQQDQDGADGQEGGRNRRRRGRRRPADGEGPKAGGGDTEARSALDSLARKQGALTGG